MAFTKNQLIAALNTIPGNPEIAIYVNTQSTTFKLPVDECVENPTPHVGCFLDQE